MFRLIFVALFAAGSAFAQGLPAFQWIQQIDGTGSDVVVGMGTDAAGNVYIAGNTTSADFPVKAAAQSRSGSAGLYRIDGPGSAWTTLGLSSAVALAIDPKNPAVLFAAASTGTVMRSADGGNTWSTLAVPASISAVAVDPVNSQIVYAGSNGQGAFKSTDSGATWVSIDNGIPPNPNYNNQFFANQIWIDPNQTNVVLARSANAVIRSADGGASWQVVLPSGFYSVSFDPLAAGVVYAASSGAVPVLKSTDDGQTWTPLGSTGLPQPSNTGLPLVLADPGHPGRLLFGVSAGLYEGAGGVVSQIPGGFFQSVDGGVTWTLGAPVALPSNISTTLVADWANGFLYCATPNTGTGIVRISSDLQTITPVGPPAVSSVNQIAIGGSHVYAVVSAGRDVFVTKLDASGNLVYSTYFGGSADDAATGMAVDSAGNVFVTGVTRSADFPTTAGAYANSNTALLPFSSFVFRLNADGSVGYSTFLTDRLSTPNAIAVDPAGSAYITGTTTGDLPVTPGAYQSSFSGTTICAFVTGHLCIFPTNAFLTKLDPAGAKLVFSTYVGSGDATANTLKIGSDGSVYLAGSAGGLGSAIWHFNSTASTLLASFGASGLVQSMAVDSAGDLYAAGTTNTPVQFTATANAFQSSPVATPVLPTQGGNNAYAFVTKLDGQLKQVLASTLLGGFYGDAAASLAVDSAGNVVVGGSTAPQGFPTRTPLASSFGPESGFLAQLDGNLSNLMFSTYLGDNEAFAVQSVAVSPDGSMVIAGSTQVAAQSQSPAHVFVNKLFPGARPPLRIDSVLNAASLLSVPLSAGETIVIRGAGFGSDAQLSIGGMSAPPISITSTAITAVVPTGIAAGVAEIQVQSGGAASNQVEAPVTAAAPGLFSVDGTGFGQGFILNADGTQNSSSNPARVGDAITIFATGVGPLSFTGPYAVTQFQPAVFIDGAYATGDYATFGPVAGIPGSVYQLKVNVPAITNVSSLAGSVLPPLVPVVLRVNGVSSQSGLALSIVQ